MIVRTCVLSACMIVVPGLALCSHHLPPEIRSAARCAVWEPVVCHVQGWFGPVADDGSPVPPEVAAEPARESEPTGLASIAGEPAAAAEHTARLVALGAVAIECRPLAAGDGGHLASCRVAMDAAGQLHRVFQTPGPSPAAATAALANQVEAWRTRLAARVAEPATEPAVR